MFTEYKLSDIEESINKSSKEITNKISTFLTNVKSRMESALQSNETIDIFHDDFYFKKCNNYIQNLTTNIRDIMVFYNSDYVQNSIIRDIQWVPNTNNMIAMTCFDNCTFEERVSKNSKNKE